jgi:hypothetical protein
VGHRLYVPLDVDFASDDKILAAGVVPAYLYIASLAFAKRTLSDGRIAAAQLVALAPGLPGNPKTHASKLVDVGLWEVTPNGWAIAAWSKRNKARSDIEAESEQKRLASVKANHERWHTNGRQSESCSYCHPKSDPSRNPNGVRTRSATESTEPEPEPEPELPSSSNGFNKIPSAAVDEEVEAVLDAYADLQRQRNGKITNVTNWRTAVITNARERTSTIRHWLDTYDLDPRSVAAGLIDGPRGDWEHHRRQAAR